MTIETCRGREGRKSLRRLREKDMPTNESHRMQGESPTPPLTKSLKEDMMMMIS
jgi:hypothetical protein